MTSKKTAKRSRQQEKPKKVSIAMYDVGFGDCFLLTFHYANGKDRHVLIDCGSSTKKKSHMIRVVDKPDCIAEHT